MTSGREQERKNTHKNNRKLQKPEILVHRKQKKIVRQTRIILYLTIP